jgi:hypothetical protein
LKDEEENRKMIEKPFKHSSMQYCFDSPDFSKWLKSPDSEQNSDKCLNDLLFTH